MSQLSALLDTIKVRGGSGAEGGLFTTGYLPHHQVCVSLSQTDSLLYWLLHNDYLSIYRLTKQMSHLLYL